MSNLTIRVENSHGGSGASTTASTLAEHYQSAGHGVFVVNADTLDDQYAYLIGKLPNR